MNTPDDHLLDDSLPDSGSATGPTTYELPVPKLADYMLPEEESWPADVAYDIYELILMENIMTVVNEFLELHPTWETRELQFTTSRKNIPLVDEGLIRVALPDGTSCELRGIPFYQHQVKGNSEDVWTLFKAVMKGENNPISWRRKLSDFEGLSERATYHVRRLESADVKRQALIDFINQYGITEIKTAPIKPDKKGFYPWYMLYSRNKDGHSVKLCIVIDNENEQQNKTQFFELAKLAATYKK